MVKKSKASPCATMDEQSRKTRKRATDRKAQREHRLRRKEYVSQLEKTVEELRAERRRDEVISELLEKQSRLQERCHALATRLSRVRTLAMDDDDDDACLRHNSSSEEIHEDHDSNPNDPHLDDSLLHDAASVQSENEGSLEAFLTGIESHDTNAMNEIGTAHNGGDNNGGGESSSLTGLPMDLPAPSDSGANRTSALDDIFPETTLPALADITLDEISLRPVVDLLGPQSFETPTMSLYDPNLQYPDFSPPFPRYCAPTSRSDAVLLSMVMEARKEHLDGRFNASQPSLHRLLSGTPTDALAFRLFNWLRGYGPMPLHLLIAVFWTQYLVLRWHVLQTQESYECMPEFLRPTPVEQVVPHQFFISMLIWPEIRLGLIKQGATSDAEGVGIKLLQHLSPNWSAERAPKLQFTLDILGAIEQQVYAPDFWKIDPGFFVKYPELRDCGKIP